MKKILLGIILLINIYVVGCQQKIDSGWKVCCPYATIYLLIGIASLLALNLLMPIKIQNPVEGCGRESYNPKSFWHPWGDHKHAGIDIFAKKGTNVHPAIGGIVVTTAHNVGLGGNFILIFSSGFRRGMEILKYKISYVMHVKIKHYEKEKAILSFKKRYRKLSQYENYLGRLGRNNIPSLLATGRFG